MTRYRWLWLRNRACAALFALAVLVVILAAAWLVGLLADGRSALFMLGASVTTLAVLLGLERWRWFRDVSDRMQGEERRAYLDERGLTL